MNQDQCQVYMAIGPIEEIEEIVLMKIIFPMEIY